MADIVYDMGDFTTLDAVTMHNCILADDFLLDADSAITIVRFWAINHSEQPALNIRFFILNDIGGQPDAIDSAIASGIAENIRYQPIGGNILYAFDLPVSVDLSADTIYWLAITAEDEGNVGGSPFWSFAKWSESDSYSSSTDPKVENFFGNPPHIAHISDGHKWKRYNNDGEHLTPSLAFQLEGKRIHLSGKGPLTIRGDG